MILLTVGKQLAFDRLVRAVDALAPQLDDKILAQTGIGQFVPQNLEIEHSIAPAKFEELVGEARLVIAHAGIGTVLSARRHGTPLIIFPRRAALGEHRNDHQMATARQLRGTPGIVVALDEDDLPAAIDKASALGTAAPVAASADNRRATALARFIEAGPGGLAASSESDA